MTPRQNIRLSVNVNKVATLRNARGGAIPDVIRAARACVLVGSRLHPRADGRHIRVPHVLALIQTFAGQLGVGIGTRH